MHRCPKCKQPTIPYWKKLFVGPLNKISCSSCGAKVTVPLGLSTFAIIIGQVSAILGLIIALTLIPKPATLTNSIIAMHIGYIIGFIPFIYFYSKKVPLVIKNA